MKNKMWWGKAALIAHADYGMRMSMEERFFYCPGCGEVIKNDEHMAHKDWRKCPLCEFDFETGCRTDGTKPRKHWWY